MGSVCRKKIYLRTQNNWSKKLFLFILISLNGLVSCYHILATFCCCCCCNSLVLDGFIYRSYVLVPLLTHFIRFRTYTRNYYHKFTLTKILTLPTRKKHTEITRDFLFHSPFAKRCERVVTIIFLEIVTSSIDQFIHTVWFRTFFHTIESRTRTFLFSTSFCIYLFDTIFM